MKRLIAAWTTSLIYACSFSQSHQSPTAIISKVLEAQDKLKTVSCALVRRDTLVTDDVRTMTGKSMIAVDHSDSVFGFKFKSKLDGTDTERIYDGHFGYELNLTAKTYSLTPHPSDYFLVNGGGQIVMTDLIKLDTSRAVRFDLSQDPQFYYLTIIYADLAEYNVEKRFKKLTISRKTMLPMGMRMHQETLGKVQDLDYQIKELHVNETGFRYSFSSLDFLNGYQPEVAIQNSGPEKNLEGDEIPAFTLTSFDNEKVSSSGLRDKIVLIDFWEVWCGPCVESMPKVQRLYDTYKDRGLLVYGITNEPKYLKSARDLVKHNGLTFPTLIGGGQTKKDFGINAIPLYLLIDKTGKVILVSKGYSDQIETMIRTALN